VAKCAAAFGMGLALRNTSAVKVGHLLNQVVIVQHQWAIRPNGKRVLIAGYRNASIRGGRITIVIAHNISSFCKGNAHP